MKMDLKEILKERLKKETLFGSFVPFAAGDVTDYTTRLGFDYVIIDNEHGIMNHETIFDMIRAAQCNRIPAIVRCTNSIPDSIHKVLDMGADGMLIPVIDTAEDARRAVTTCLYPPEGDRGIAYFTRSASYGMIKNKNEFLREENRKLFISIQLETAGAVKNLDEILEVDRIDMFFIGPNDLAASLGLPNPSAELTEIIEKMIAKITAKGKTAGIFVNSADAAERAKKWGARFLLTSITQFMTKGVTEYLKDARNR